MFILKGKRVKLSTLVKWADREEDRSAHITFSNKNEVSGRFVAADLIDGDEVKLLDANQIIDDYSHKVLGHKWMDGKTK